VIRENIIAGPFAGRGESAGHKFPNNDIGILDHVAVFVEVGHFIDVRPAARRGGPDDGAISQGSLKERPELIGLVIGQPPSTTLFPISKMLGCFSDVQLSEFPMWRSLKNQALRFKKRPL